MTPRFPNPMLVQCPDSKSPRKSYYNPTVGTYKTRSLTFPVSPRRFTLANEYMLHRPIDHGQLKHASPHPPPPCPPAHFLEIPPTSRKLLWSKTWRHLFTNKKCTTMEGNIRTVMLCIFNPKRFLYFSPEVYTPPPPTRSQRTTHSIHTPYTRTSANETYKKRHGMCMHPFGWCTNNTTVTQYCLIKTKNRTSVEPKKKTSF